MLNVSILSFDCLVACLKTFFFHLDDACPEAIQPPNSVNIPLNN